MVGEVARLGLGENDDNTQRIQNLAQAMLANALVFEAFGEGFNHLPKMIFAQKTDPLTLFPGRE